MVEIYAASLDEQQKRTDEQQKRTGGALARAAAIMARLRGPGGCPWDREQTFDSIKRHTLEETYEVFDAIERRAWPELRDELGDLLLQVLFYAEMASEAGYFTLEDVADGLSAKLIRRHPHIFGDAVAEDSETVLRHWEQVKREEKLAAGAAAEVSGLDGVSRAMPALPEAGKLGAKAAKAGFDWPDARGLIAKLREETGEIEAELGTGDRDALEMELGDLLFTAVNLARHTGVDPEFALRRTNGKFRRRYAAMEKLAGGTGQFAASGAEEKEELWARVKGAKASAPADPLGEQGPEKGRG